MRVVKGTEILTAVRGRAGSYRTYRTHGLIVLCMCPETPGCCMEDCLSHSSSQLKGPGFLGRRPKVSGVTDLICICWRVVAIVVGWAPDAEGGTEKSKVAKITGRI